MAKRKNKSQAEIEYNKQLNRIKRFIRRNESRGFQFDDIIPNKPKRVTKASVNRLKKITPDVLYKHSVYGGEATQGEIVSGRRGRKLAREYARQKTIQDNKRRKYDTEPLSLDDYSKLIIANFKSTILHFPQEIADKIIALINQIQLQQGEIELAQALNDMPLQFHEYLNVLGYDSGEAVKEFSAALVDYLPEASDAYKEDLIEAFEMNELGYDV